MALSDGIGGAPILPYSHLVGSLGHLLHTANGPAAVLVLNVTDAIDLHTELGLEGSAPLFIDMGERLSAALAGRGALMRIGEASWCIFVNGVRNAGHAALASEKFARAVEAALSANGVSIGSRVQVGIAQCPPGGGEADVLLRQAQLAAAAARKRSVRVVSYDEACADQVLRPGQLGRALAEALESGSLTVAYQPKVDARTEHVVGVEALMRWTQDGATVATPDVFIPLAEEIGLFHGVTWYSLSNALRTSVAHEQLPVAVNVSPRMLHHREFVEMIDTAVRTWHVEPGVLTLELTEGALVADFEQAVHAIEKVRRLGVRVSIDDFGTGYSSLSYFKRIPADELKIDKSFVLRMLDDPADQRLVQAIVTLARQFHLKVVAEGVENRETLRYLAALSCDVAQGFLFAPALESGRLAEWLAAPARPGAHARAGRGARRYSPS